MCVCVFAGPYPVCSPLMVPCLREGGRELLRGDLVNKIYGGCPTPCNQLIYERSLSSAFISNHVSQRLQKKMNASRTYLNDNYAKLDLFFSELSYTKITSLESYPVLSLFCDIGGAMGLILGSTFLTAVEFFEFLCENVLFFLFRRGKSSKLY